MRTFVLALLAAGCATPRASEQKLAIIEHDYAFEGAVGSRTFAGTLSFANERYVFQSDFGSCTGDLIQRTFAGPYFTFGCGGLTVRFAYDKGRVREHALATFAEKKVVGFKRICARYVTDKDGKRVCADWFTEPIEKVTTQRGSVTVAKADF